MKVPRDLLVSLGIILLAHGISLQQPLMSEDHGFVSIIERRGSLGAVADAASGRFLGVLEFWRPGEMATHVIAYAVGGSHPALWQAFNLFLLGSLVVGCWWCLGLLGVRGWARVFALLALGLHPVQVETQGAGLTRGSLMADVWQVFATALCLKGSLFSLPIAALGYVTKESAFAFGPFIGALLMATSTDRRSPRLWTLLLLHAALAVGLFFARLQILGELSAPYGRSWDVALREGVAEMPETLLRIVGIAPLLLIALGVSLCIVTRRWSALLPLAGLTALLLPVLPLPLNAVEYTGNGRCLLAFTVFTTLVGAWWLKDFPRVAIAALVAVALASAASLPATWRDFVDLGAEAKAIGAAIHEQHADALLVAEMPHALTWSYPAAARPPFDRTGRTVFALRGGTDIATLCALRPAADDVAIAVARNKDLLLVPARMDSYAAWLPKGHADRRGGWVADEFPILGARLATLRLRPIGDARQGTVIVGLALANGSRRIHVLPWVGTDHVRALLSDIPELPIATVDYFRITGAQLELVEPPLPGRLAVVQPQKGVAIDAAWLVRPFEFANIPEGTQGFRTTIHTPLGSLAIITHGTTWSFALLEATQPGTFDNLLVGLPHASRLFLTIDALADPTNPGSILDRCPTFLIDTNIKTAQ